MRCRMCDKAGDDPGEFFGFIFYGEGDEYRVCSTHPHETDVCVCNRCTRALHKWMSGVSKLAVDAIERKNRRPVGE